MEEIYGNYPATMFELVELYKKEKDEKQARLAEMVKRNYVQILEEQEKSYKLE